MLSFNFDCSWNLFKILFCYYFAFDDMKINEVFHATFCLNSSRSKRIPEKRTKKIIEVRKHDVFRLGMKAARNSVLIRHALKTWRIQCIVAQLLTSVFSGACVKHTVGTGSYRRWLDWSSCFLSWVFCIFEWASHSQS